MTTNTLNGADLKLNVNRNTDLLGRKIASYSAHLGGTGWSATAPCKQGAIDLLYADLRNHAENQFKRKYIRKGDVTFSLYYAGGWCYDIVRDNGHVSTSSFQARSYQDAVERMEAHARQHDGI